MPTEEDIGKAYRTYYTHTRRADSLSERLVADTLYAVLGLYRERRRADTMYLNGIAPGRLLEVGFGDGRRLEQFAARGWTVEGQEVDPVAVDKARMRGLTVHAGPLPDCNLPAEGFDAIISSHVIEHVHCPLAVARECFRLLAPGGRLIFATPNTASYGHRRFGPAWLGLDPPRHLHLFDAGSLRDLLAQAGFTQIRVQTTMVHAAAVLQRSHQIARRGESTITAFPRFLSVGSVIAHLTRARLEQVQRADAGEELVAIAVKLGAR